MTLYELAERLGCELTAGGDREVTGVAGVEQASPSKVTFLSNPRYRAKARDTRAATLRLGSPAGPSSLNASLGGRPTSTCKSTRSSNGPDTLLR